LLIKKFLYYLKFLDNQEFSSPPCLTIKAPFSPELLEVQGVVSIQVQLVKEVVQLLSWKKLRSWSLHCKKKVIVFSVPSLDVGL
jgi:hypothetical protein